MFVAFGVAFAVGSLRYELGTLLAMGPGYVPLVVACVLVALGTAIIVKAFVAPDTAAPGVPARDDGEAVPPMRLDLRAFDWRAIALITAAPLFFGFTVSGLGLLPAAFGTGVLAAFARKGTSIVRVALTAAGLTLTSYLIFVVLLQVRLDLFGDWLGG